MHKHAKTFRLYLIATFIDLGIEAATGFFIFIFLESRVDIPPIFGAIGFFLLSIVITANVLRTYGMEGAMSPRLLHWMFCRVILITGGIIALIAHQILLVGVVIFLYACVSLAHSVDTRFLPNIASVK